MKDNAEYRWILPCDSKDKYDVFGAFDALKRIDWHQTMQTKNISVGEIVYIYAKGIGICFKAHVTKTDVHSLEIDDRKYAYDTSYEKDIHEYFEIECDKKYSKKEVIGYSDLKRHGLKSTLQGPTRIKEDVLKFIKLFDENGMILDADLELGWNKIYDAINDCFGMNYTGWMTGTWPNNNGNGKFRAWFPKLAKKNNGKYESAAFDCINYISDDGNEFVFDDLKGTIPNPELIYDGYDLIFSKENGGQYIFRGVYILDKEKSAPNHCVSKRVAKRVKIIGSPATDIEILDDIRRNDINIPLEPISTEIGEDNIVKVTCGNCRHVFTKAPRCPECGQLIKY